MIADGKSALCFFLDGNTYYGMGKILAHVWGDGVRPGEMPELPVKANDTYQHIWSEGGWQ